MKVENMRLLPKTDALTPLPSTVKDLKFVSN